MIPKGTLCPLSTADIDMIKAQAELRWKHDEEKGCEYTAYTNKTKQEAEQDSFGAEIAFCRLFGLEPDMQIGVYLPYDAIYRGVTIDVKQTDESWKGLDKKIKANNEKELYPQAYVLITGRLPFFVYRGATLKEVLISENFIKPGAKPGWNSYYLLGQRYLLDLDEVVRLIKNGQ